jgi:hypothetical protein
MVLFVRVRGASYCAIVTGLKTGSRLGELPKRVGNGKERASDVTK